MSGKSRYVRKAFRGSKRAAQQAFARLVAEVGDGEHVGTDATFAELLERWYERSVGDWSPATARQHRSIMDRQVKPVLGPKAITKLTTADIDALYAQLRKRGAPGGRALGPASVRRTHVVIHSALAQAVRWKWLRVNPGRDRPRRISRRWSCPTGCVGMHSVDEFDQADSSEKWSCWPRGRRCHDEGGRDEPSQDRHSG